MYRRTWGTWGKHGGEREDLVCAGDQNVWETRVCGGNSEQMVVPQCVMRMQSELHGTAEGVGHSGELPCLRGLLGHQEDPTARLAPPCAAPKGPRRSLPSLSYLLCWARLLLSLMLSLLALSQLF